MRFYFAFSAFVAVVNGLCDFSALEERDLA